VPYTDEVQTPMLDALVREGIELDRAYTYKYCSPTRSALQSGRHPYHVNPLNADPAIANRSDPVSGFAAIPRNMTGIATKMAAAGYKTAAFGKWDAGMATPDHTPHGRGYQRALNYFHHANDYWSMSEGSCAVAPTPTPGPPAPPSKCSNTSGANFCLGSSPVLSQQPTREPKDCCALCSVEDKCAAWTWGLGLDAKTGNHTCFLHSAVTKKNPSGNCTSACRVPGCIPVQQPVTDLWAAGEAAAPGGASHEGPARGLNNTCAKGHAETPGGAGCAAGPSGDTWHDGYEDSLFEQHVLDTIAAHDAAAAPLFLFWAPHIVHAPLETPQEFIDKVHHPLARHHPLHIRICLAILD